MGVFLNFSSFFLMVISLALFLGKVFFEQRLPQELSYPVLFGLVLLTFVLGMIGTVGVENWKSAARTISTVLVTGLLSIMLIFIVFIGTLFG
ncbi:hypothetical protein [Pseudalkalibacillus berkeleyi]|uniref:YesK-like protein n=1 Tax=Pseudalkalibacillus berkeleyi TaxID=1069813 RepID=A0ABS9GV10_9BACL|nr:hypothetical protein [Pseudalkalibacillus berkeleyi]MCF6136678.1 hypothetical protein [Pseudalkalibacillus berkeleyi]